MVEMPELVLGWSTLWGKVQLMWTADLAGKLPQTPSSPASNCASYSFFSWSVYSISFNSELLSGSTKEIFKGIKGKQFLDQKQKFQHILIFPSHNNITLQSSGYSSWHNEFLALAFQVLVSCQRSQRNTESTCNWMTMSMLMCLK